MAKQKSTALGGWLAKARQFLDEFPVDGVNTRPLVRQLRTTAHFIRLVVRGFVENRCPLRAAALCYTTLLALIPLLAVMFSISKSFLRDRSSEVVPKVLNGLINEVAPQLQFMPAGGAGPAEGQVVVSSQGQHQVVETIQTFIGNIDAGTLGLVGSLALILVAVRLLMTIEQTFNDIWGVQKGRSLWRKIVYYWTSITLGPIVLLAALTATGTAEFAGALGKLSLVPGSERALLHLAPYLILWVGFALMYALMPNTRVRFQAALIGGIVAGTLWQLNSLLNTMYVSRVVTYSKIYGALGIIPVFLIGLYFSWLIVLLGAQVSFAAQHVRTYMQHRVSEKIDAAGRELLACRAVLQVCHCFLHTLKPPTTAELAERLRAPLQTLNQLAHRLIEGGVLVELAEGGLQPARPPDSITVADVLHVVRTSTGACSDELKRPSSGPVEQLLFDLTAALRAAPINARFSDLVAKHGAE
jgi:membrane protein